MKRHNLHVLVLAAMLLLVLPGCDINIPDTTKGTDPVTLPTQSVATTVPITGPSVSSSLPDNAVQQEDGNYVLTQYVNAMGSSVEQDRAEYIHTTVYTPDGMVLSVEEISIKTGHVRYIEAYQYDGSRVSCVTSRYFDKNGNFRMHYAEHFDGNGALRKREDFDRDGELTLSTEYVYFDDGSLQSETCYAGNGTRISCVEYDTQKRLVSEQRWHSNGKINEENYYVDGVLSVITVYDQNGELTTYIECWPNGQNKFTKTLGHYMNGELINGWVIGEYAEDGMPQHDATYYPDGSLCMEIYYYPSGNTKSTYSRDPYNSYHSEYYAEYYDGMETPYTGWNVINGEKVYFGKALQEQNPDKVYDDRGNLLQYTETNNGYTYEVYRTYDEKNRKLTEECIGSDGSRAYTEYAYTDQMSGAVYSERTGKFCQEEGAIRYVFDVRSGMNRYEWFYNDGSYTLSIDTASGKPYYLSYVYADGRKEIYEYDEGELTYMYIECEDGSVIKQGTPRES